MTAERGDPDEPVVIRSFAFEWEAELARATLAAAEIPCMLMPTTYAPWGQAPVKLAVRRQDAIRANAVLDEADAGE